MRKLTRHLLLAAAWLAILPAVIGAVPPINVAVSDDRGKVTFKGSTSPAGSFTTAILKPGNYIVQFSSTNGALKGGRYQLLVTAAKVKVLANGVAGEKFLGSGVAMKITVGTSQREVLKNNQGLNNPAAIRALARMEHESAASITGHVTAQ